MSDLVIIARFSSRPEAIVAQSLLRSEGIETLMPDFNVLMAEFDPSMMEHGWRLMVHEADAEEARGILRDAQLEAGED
jgi:division protein CdvB (Snf7/Vps24/ESCRT-III family)